MFSTIPTNIFALLFHLLIPTTILTLSQANLKNFSHHLPAASIKSLRLDRFLLEEDAKLTDFGVLASQHNSHLIASSFIYGLGQVAKAGNINANCYRDLKHIQRGVLRKEPWAIKVLDASGSKSSGFVFGDNYWFGSRETCEALRYPLGLTLSPDHQRIMHNGLIHKMPPFPVDYRVVYLKHNSPWQIELKVMSEQIIHVGLCLPSACTNDEIQYLIAAYIQQGLFRDNDIYDMLPEVLYVKDLHLSEAFYQRDSFRLLTAFFAFTLAMILTASFLRRKPETAALSVKSENEISILHSPPLTFTSFSPSIQQFILCFDITENWTKLFTIKSNGAEDIPIMNGLRSLCSIWILFFHVVWYMYFTVNNKPILVSYAEAGYFQYLSSAPIIVDVFFTISGFLHVYNFLRNDNKLKTVRHNNLWQNFQQFMKMLFHRYVRFFPLYLVVIVMVDLFYAYMEQTSIFHIHERFDRTCSKYWWRNLLFIQNFYAYDDMCLNWSWSLACEMQFFILASLMLFLYAKNPNLAKALTMVALAANILWSYVICLRVNFQLSFDTFLATSNHVYFSSFVRILPYIIGCMAAWYMLEVRQRQFHLSDQQASALWTASILIFFLCMFSTIKRDIAAIYATTLIVGGRLCFALAVSWMICGSATGRSCWWSRLLETKLFQHLNKLSYAIYLLNPFIIALFFGITNASTHFHPIMLCVFCSGFVVIIYLLSIVMSLLFEMPFYNISSR